MTRFTRKATAYVVILGLMILAGLVLSPILLIRWRDRVTSEAQYKVAPKCGGTEQNGCRREIEAVVKNTHDVSGRTKKTYYVSLVMPGTKLNGEIPISWEADHGLYNLLKPGDRVTAEEWEGQIMAIRGAGKSTLRTEYDPAYQARGLLTSLVVVPLITALSIFIEYKLIRSRRRSRR